MVVIFTLPGLVYEPAANKEPYKSIKQFLNGKGHVVKHIDYARREPSRSDGAVTYDFTCDDDLAIIKHELSKVSGKVVLIGHSLGGAYAVHEINHPAVAAVIAVNAPSWHKITGGNIDVLNHGAESGFVNRGKGFTHTIRWVQSVRDVMKHNFSQDSSKPVFLIAPDSGQDFVDAKKYAVHYRNAKLLQINGMDHDTQNRTFELLKVFGDIADSL